MEAARVPPAAGPAPVRDPGVPVRVCRAVLFDVDDTLYEVAQLVAQSWRVHAADLGELGLDVSALLVAYERCRHRRTLTGAVREALVGLGRGVDDAHQLAGRLGDLCEGFTPRSLDSFAGVRDLLASMRAAGVRTGVVSNGDPVRQRAKLTALGLAEAFDVVVVCDGVTVPKKPDPAGFVAALDALGVDASEAVMVGDRVDNDIVPALGLGMAAVRIRVGNHAAADGVSGVPEAEDPAAVWEVVRRLATAT